MSVVQDSHPLSIPVTTPLAAKHPWWRSLVLFAFLLCSIALYALLITFSPRQDGVIASFVQVWMFCFLPYFAACAFVLATKPVQGRWQWIELGIILGGALVVRAILLPLPPELSRDYGAISGMLVSHCTASAPMFMRQGVRYCIPCSIQSSSATCAFATSPQSIRRGRRLSTC
jgi:hypothetical protein